MVFPPMHAIPPCGQTWPPMTMGSNGCPAYPEWHPLLLPCYNIVSSVFFIRHCPFSFQTLNNINTGSIRQRLKNTKDHGNKQRQSPVPANHLALSMTAPAVLIRSAAIGIPAHIPKMPRHQRNSVEGLNQVSTDLVPPGHLAQSVKCLATDVSLTADTEVAS